ncbi:MAG: nucleotide exchange factor GrpE [Caldilineales bacterium]|nr:nucleotide exchange factor GrpE [Caldilineales bacterium]MDW8316460.1 nucleotide exchange factor GrpE [Anaerolineae bacterium]
MNDHKDTTFEAVQAPQATPVEEASPQPEAAPGDAAPAPAWQALIQAAEEGAADLSDPVVQLVQEYKEAVKARDAWEDKYLRAAADFANAKRRAEMRADSQILAARERILAAILPVLDDFERAFKAVPAEAQQSPWVEGFALIQRKLRATLEREGVTEIQAEGQPFDPVLHQAVVSEPAAGVEPGTVIEVLQKGYTLEGRVLRPSMVKVAQ